MNPKFFTLLIWIWPKLLMMNATFKILSILRLENLLHTNSEKKWFYFCIFSLFFLYLCQVEGHGETLSKFSVKLSKNFSRQIWKIFSGFIYLRPLYRNMILIWLDTQWERLWHFWTTVMSVQCLLCSSRDLNCLIQWLFWCCNHQICIFR